MKIKYAFPESTTATNIAVVVYLLFHVPLGQRFIAPKMNKNSDA